MRSAMSVLSQLEGVGELVRHPAGARMDEGGDFDKMGTVRHRHTVEHRRKLRRGRVAVARSCGNRLDDTRRAQLLEDLGGLPLAQVETLREELYGNRRAPRVAEDEHRLHERDRQDARQDEATKLLGYGCG